MAVMKHILFLALALTACAASDEDRPSSANASRTFASANLRMETALSRIGSLAPVAVTVNLSEPCAISGGLGVAGTYDSAGEMFDLTASFTACVESGAEGTLDGSLHWTSSTVGDTTTQNWDGTLVGDDGSVSWSCLFDLTIVEDANGVTRSGTICGYDASTL